VLAVVVLALLAILPAGMGQDEGRVSRLVVLSAVAEVLRHVVLRVAVVAVWTGPAEEGKQLLCGQTCLAFLDLFLFTVESLPDLASPRRGLLNLFFVLILVVESLDPAFDAAQVEGVATLAAAPDCTAVENWVLTYQALSGAFREGLHEVGALFRQVRELVQKVLMVVLHGRPLLSRFPLALLVLVDVLDLFFLDHRALVPFVT